MYKVKSTYKVLADKVLEQGSREEWIDWALEMVMAGFESEHLIILAGLTLDTNRFEFDDIVNRALKELSLDKATKDEIVYAYVYYLVSEAIEGNISKRKVLRELRDLCQNRDYDEELFKFYLLYYALDELENLGVQSYWNNGDNNDIDIEIDNELRSWKNGYEANKLNIA